MFDPLRFQLALVKAFSLWSLPAKSYCGDFCLRPLFVISYTWQPLSSYESSRLPGSSSKLGAEDQEILPGLRLGAAVNLEIRPETRTLS